jgi:hypothetical protein
VRSPQRAPDVSHMDDQRFYDQVAEEILANDIKRGLWTKAYSRTDGNEAATKANYIKLRVEQLMSEANEEARSKKQQERDAAPRRRRGGILALLTGIVFLGIGMLSSVAMTAGGGWFAGLIGVVFLWAGYYLIRWS